MSHPVSVFIIVFTLLNIAGCLWLMWWTARVRVDAQAPQGAEPERTSHVWDGDLAEYNNPLPRWWLGLFIITVVFAIGYLVVFPGLGSYGGSSNWSQVGAWKAQT